MAANRVKRSTSCCFLQWTHRIIKLSREHNNANILSIGARFMSEDEIRSVLDVWFNEPFGGGRHQRRIDKLDL